MDHYAGIDVSLELSSLCVVDAQGKIVKEAKVASEPEALVAFFTGLGFALIYVRKSRCIKITHAPTNAPRIPHRRRLPMDRRDIRIESEMHNGHRPSTHFSSQVSHDSRSG